MEQVQEQPVEQAAPSGGLLGEVAPTPQGVEEKATPPSWSEQISQEVRSIDGASALLEKYGSIDELFKGAVNAQKMIGDRSENTIKTLGENPTDEEISKFYDSIGRPKSAAEYTWQPGDDLDLDQEAYSAKAAELHKVGLTDKQHNQVMNMYKEELMAANDTWHQQQEETARATEAQLKHEWGNEYDLRIKQARNVADKYAIMPILKQYGLDNQKPVIDLLYQVSQLTSEDTIQAPVAGQSVEHEMAEIKKHPGYMDKGHPSHKDLVKRMLHLRTMA